MRTLKTYIEEQKTVSKEEWIKSNKKRFKDRYGDEWETVLYATANKLYESDAPANVTSGVANPDAKPIFRVKRRKELGHECFEVDEDLYNKCIKGKVPFERWSKYVSNEEDREMMKRVYQRNKRVIVKHGNKMAYMK